MFCKKCSNDKFAVIKKHANARYLKDKRRWVYSDDYDTRRIACLKCGRTFLTETIITCEVELRGDGSGSVEPPENSLF